MPDDGLAPVTDIFGARSSARATSSRRAPAEGGAPFAEPGAHGASMGGPDGDDAIPVGLVRDETDVDRPDASDAWLPPVTGSTVGSVETVGPAAPVRRLRAADRDDDAEHETVESAPTQDELLAEAERISIRALSRRGTSTSELRTALLGRELPEDIVEHEIARLVRVGLLDDVRLAADLVDRLHDRKGLGRQGVVAELRRRGVDQAAIDAALADQDDDAAESERAIELARKRAGQMRGLDHETAERRLSGFLMRKGYGGSVVRTAVRIALDGGGRRGGVRFE
ncbi:regulatory protein RecX [Curtobacterium sp. MCBD17_035]|uniref:regulatory protein RecX n=1 Tax=Curtobacterium sp. MCBD17_035 TaxID=2175673 RepID=UPI000DA8A2AF|nr:regulatory protein RecX [Curtobacterium sp. MCBD17_035]WIB68327.1 regulatory protein RecX [Curtobacterium sp. MCBD17_035]